ncbi:MAG: putative photosynthetic complex assembly protein PuhE, partial [Pseudomonadota bacterium]
MLETVAPIAFALLAWWVSTGVLIWLVGRGPWVRRSAAGILTLAAIGATVSIVALRSDTSLSGAYVGFAVGLLLWAWHEAMLLFGYISGSRRMACPPGLTGWPRFKTSTQAIWHHELGIGLHAALIVWLSVGAANQMAAATYLLLWAMRISAKLLIFLGARNATDTFLPSHLKYLSTYFNTARTTRFFPVFLCLTSMVAFVLLFQGLTATLGSFEAVAYLLIGTLALLAAFEHLALVLPLQDERLFSWAIRENAGAETQQQNDKL